MPGNIMPVVSKQEVGVAQDIPCQSTKWKRDIKKLKHEHIDIEQKKSTVSTSLPHNPDSIVCRSEASSVPIDVTHPHVWCI